MARFRPSRFPLFYCVVCLLLGPALSLAGRSSQSSVEGRPLMITTIKREPFLIYDEKCPSDSIKCFTGFIPDLVQEVARLVPFSYQFRLVADGLYGNAYFITDSPLWSGMVGEVHNGTADFAAAPLPITEERKVAVDFTIPWWNLSHTALVRQDLPINTLEDLLSNEHIQYGVVYGTATQKRFQGRPDLPYARMWARMASSNDAFLKSLQEGLERTRNEDFALLMETQDASYLAANLECEFKILKPFMMGQVFGFAVQKRDPLKFKLNRALYELLQSGKVTELYNRWWAKNNCRFDHWKEEYMIDPVSSKSNGGTKFTMNLQYLLVCISGAILFVNSLHTY